MKRTLALVLVAFLLTGCEARLTFPPAELEFTPLIRGDCGRAPGCLA